MFVRHPELRCPACGHPLDSACPVSAPAEPQINEGDVSVCAYCAVAIIWRDSRWALLMDWSDIEDENVAALQYAQRVVRASSLYGKKP